MTAQILIPAVQLPHPGGRILRPALAVVPVASAVFISTDRRIPPVLCPCEGGQPYHGPKPGSAKSRGFYGLCPGRDCLYRAAFRASHRNLFEATGARA